MALEISKLNTTGIIEEGAKKPEPIIVFLTDGLPNVRVSDPDTIVSDVTKANTRNSSIFSLALGNDADFNFLKKLSLTNQGFARKIYEAADTALQLTDFYREIASPLLANVHFEYTPDELVVAGKLTDAGSFNGTVVAGSADGKTEFKFRPIIIDPWPRPYPPFPPILPHPVPVDNHTVTSMEKLWAYLTIQQLLEEDEAKDYDHNDKNQTSPELKKALGLALKTNTAYSSCTTPEGLQGHCRHLRYCVLGVFTANKDDFLPYFCHINRLVYYMMSAYVAQTATLQFATPEVIC
ncbi:Inter-alpha-trypsin inhibitor heavy chain H4 [Blattella germanica]|nr:Inter-alpha-trypsin inhibitor heavy chain H4 [Blattella germanica]